MTSDRGLQGALHSWLHEDRHEDATRILHTVLDGVGTTPQHRPGWSVGGILTMNKFVAIGLGAAAVVVALFLGSQLIGGPPPGGPPVESTAPSEAEPSPSGEAGLPVGSTVVLANEVPGAPLSATIPAPGWEQDDSHGVLGNGGSEPDGAYTAGNWYGDPLVPSNPCQWSSTMPDTPATTLDEIVAAFASQATRDASTPVDVTVDGYPGKVITLHIPADIAWDPPNSDGFTDCDEGKFCTLGFAADVPTCYMWYQGPDEFQEIWIIDVDGEFVFQTGNYWPGTPPEVVDELGELLASMTFAE
jgi:hypothetical protein